MKRTAALLLALSLSVPVAACGGDQDEAGPGGPAPASETASVGTVRILHQTNAGGSTTDQAAVLRTQSDVDAFVADLDGGLVDGIQRAYDAQARNAGTVLLASVVAIGCEVPKDATVSREGGSLVITPQKVPTGTKQCFAPVTSVALATVDETDLPG